MIRAMAHPLAVAVGLSVLNVFSLDLDPKLVGSWPGFRPDPGLAVRVEGDRAYLLSYSHLHVFDVSNPRSPVRMGGYDFGSDAQRPATLAVAEKYAFVGGMGDGALHVIDFRNPVAPQRLAKLTNSAPLDLAVFGTNVLLVNENRLSVVDISNPADPQTIAVHSVTNEFLVGVAVEGRYAFVSSLTSAPLYRAALRIFDMGNPSVPRLVGTYEVDGVSGFQADVAVSGNHAYLLVDALYVIDITDPANPQKVAALELSSETPEFSFPPRSLALSPDSPHAYVLTARELNEPTVILVDSEVFLNSVESRVEIIDVSNPAAPTHAGSFSTTSPGSDDGYPEFEHQSMAVFKGVLYFAGAHPVLKVIDVSNPAAPKEIVDSEMRDWALDVAVVGNYAYVTEGNAGLQVLDISQPENPRRVGHHPWRAGRIVLSGRWAYLLGDDLQIVNTDNPATPKLAGRFAVNSPRGLTIAGQHAYVITSPRWTETNLVSSELVILDVTQPENPQFVGRYVPENRPFPPGENPLLAVAVAGNYAWLSERAGLSVIDISDPRNPRRVNEPIADELRYTDLFCSENLLYALSSGELHIMDVRNPVSPVLLSTYRGFRDLAGEGFLCPAIGNPEHWVGGLGLQILGEYAYMALGNGFCSLKGTALNIVDISNPANPRGVGLLSRIFRTPNPFLRERKTRMALSGDHLFMADRNAGLQVIKVAPANPQRAGAYGSNGIVATATSGNYAYVAQFTGFNVIDISNPDSPRPVGGLKTPGRAVATFGDFVFLIDGLGRALHVVNVSDGRNPVVLRTHGRLNAPLLARVAGHYLYLLEEGPNAALSILDIRNAPDLIEIGTYRLLGFPGALAISGGYAYIASNPDGLSGELLVVDVSNPANIQRIATYKTDGAIFGVAVTGALAYVTEWNGESSFKVLDITDPANPRPVASCKTGGNPSWGMIISGNYVYLAQGREGLLVIDIADPANPRIVGGNSSTSAFSASVANGRLFVLNDEGLLVLHEYNPIGFEPFALGDAGAARLRITGPPGVPGRLQRSTDLRTWSDWQPINFTARPLELIDPDAGSQLRRFYRIAAP